MPQLTNPLEYLPFWRSAGAALLALLVIGSLTPVSLPSGGPSLPHLDKLIHFSAYALLTSWYLVVFPMPKARLLVPAGLLATGLGVEWLQGLTGYRQADLLDAAANLSGILLAPLLAPSLHHLLCAIEQRFGGTPATPRRRLRRQGLWQVIGLHLAVMLIPIAFLPIELATIPIPHIDKALHFFTYGLLTAWLLLAFPGRTARIVVPLLMLSLSATVELMQGFTSYGGEPSLFDALADTAGILLASAVVISPLRHLLLKIETTSMPHSKRRSKRRKRHVSRPQAAPASVDPSAHRNTAPTPVRKRYRRRRSRRTASSRNAA